MSNIILTADLHLTDDPLDEYRWQIFPFLYDKIRGVSESGHAGWIRDRTDFSGGWYLFILGDLADKKDYHSGAFVNRVVNNIVWLYKAGLLGIVILGGNHDGLGGTAFFEFLRNFPFVTYVTKPEIITIGMRKIAMLPHTRTPADDWSKIDFSSVQYVMAHATVKGARSETGHQLDGQRGAEALANLRLGIVANQARVFSGDVHVPQRVGALEYIGAPYPIKFGDRFQGRVLVLGHRGRRDEWYPPGIKRAKLAISSVAELDKAFLRRGDQLKVELVLPKSERQVWHQLKDEVVAWCKRKEVVLCQVLLGATPVLRLKMREAEPVVFKPEEALETYLRRTKPPEAVAEVGRRLLRIAQKRPVNER